MKKVTNENKTNKQKVSKAITFVSLVDKLADLKNLKTVPYAFNCGYKCLPEGAIKLFS
jgi:hypothetical protein